MCEITTTLNSLPMGKKCTVWSLLSQGILRRRMLDLGLVKGTKITSLQKSPWGNPAAYYIRGSVIALRKEDADKIVVRYDE